ncbi:hypothetical protein H5410_002151 [Solanum commersonii]|uniref:Uncharacterized protein n=1 Tax=Solanum commersonii TaxID=4109 RepID=A0A9J6B1I0_SOLCO|nr:hypothetical protein H5410_002151 [Solanum commersonii]
MEFRNHVRTTHPSMPERNIILRSHVYASSIFLMENLSSTQLVAPQHVSLQNVILPSPIYASETFYRENPSPSQYAALAHASSQNAILRFPIFASNNFFPEILSSTQPLTPQHMSSRRNDGVVILSISSWNYNHSIRNDRTSTIDRQQMARRNNVVPIRRGRALPMNMVQMERRNIVGGSNSTFRNSNETIVYGTRQLINQLDIPISPNADELVNLVEEQNDLDLNLRL